MQELNGINIKSAMNSGTDILGRFYEQFLKYGNGAKEIGIVLTPRHITRMAVDALDTTYHDTLLDPACGTGGFLVAAYDHVRKNSSPKQLDKFKDTGIFGIEQDPEVVALALVNMIFRGDGKNNIIEGNCFTTDKFKTTKMTRVLMNPPFALKKESEKEYKFVDLALERMDSGGLLFVILPSPVMFRGANYKTWRQNLLVKHTLRAVIKLPEDLFYPIGVHTSAVVVQACRPHEKTDRVLWAWLDDGFIKKKGVMIKLQSNDGNTVELLSVLKSHLIGQSITDKSKRWKQCPIEWDSFLECSPEAYLDDIDFNKKAVMREMDNILANLISCELNYHDK